MRTVPNGMCDPSDIKIFILYLLDSIDYPLDYETIHDIVADSGYVGRFEFAEEFSKLKELGHILEDKEGDRVYYAISPTGKMVANELQSELLLSIREKSLKSALRFLSFQRRNATWGASVEERKDGKYNLHCEITDANGKLLCLDLCAASRLQAEQIKTRFEKEPEEIYRRLLTVLSGNIDYLLS